MTTFIYNGTKIETPNLEKKLKRMKITMDDITIVEDIPKPKAVEEDLKEITLYTFSNGNYKIISINNECPIGYAFEGSKLYKM